MKILALALLLTSISTFAEKIKVHVPGMVCQMCVKGMQKHFKSVVQNKRKDIIVDLDTKMVTLTTLASISDDEIKKRVKLAGYDVKAIERLK